VAGYRWRARALLGATFVLLFCAEPIAVRFWFAVAVTAGIVSFVTLLSRRLLFASVVTSSLVAVVFLLSPLRCRSSCRARGRDDPGGVDLALRQDAALAFGFGLDLGRCNCGGGSI
jgi:hypothetical protein